MALRILTNCLAEKDVREIHKHSHTLLENVQRECKKYHDTGVQCVAVYSKTVSKAIYCFIDPAMCALVLPSPSPFSLEWESQRQITTRLHLAVGDLKTTQNELQLQIFACKLLIKNLYYVFDNRYSIPKHNITIIKSVDIFLRYYANKLSVSPQNPI